MTPCSASHLRNDYLPGKRVRLSHARAKTENVARSEHFVFFFLSRTPVRSGGGYTTDFVLFSASGAANGSLQFNAQSGEPLLIQLR